MSEPVSYVRIPEDALERWATVRDICAGDQALRSDDYLPYINRLDVSQANKDRNSSYRARAVLYTATSFTRDGLLGLAFRYDPRAQLPARLEYLTTDCDGAGTSIYQQSQEVLGNVLEVGRHGLYVDFSEALSRPTIKSYSAESIINWRETQVAGQKILTMVVLREAVEIEDGYGVTMGVQWRELVLEDGRCICRIWAQTDNGPVLSIQTDSEGQEVTEIVLASRRGPLEFVPFFFIGSESNSTAINPSPLYGLARLNLAHFRNSADYEDSVFFVGQVQPWISGLTEEWRDHLQANGTYIGSRAAVLLPVGGAFGFAQAQPNMIAKEAMEHKEAQMVALGARIIEAKLANKTATGEDNDREVSTSVLALACSNVSEAYQAVIRACGRYLDMDIDSEPFQSTYKINQDFVKAAANPAIMGQLVAAWQTGLMAKSDVRAFFRRQGVLATERTDELIDEDLALEGPVLGMAGTQQGEEDGLTR